MKLLLGSFLAVGAVVLTVAVVPQSSWSFHNQVDMLTGRYNGESLLTTITRFGKDESSLFTTRTPEQLLAQGELEPQGSGIAIIESYCATRPEDIKGWTALTRKCSAGIWIPPTEPGGAKRKQQALGSQQFRKGFSAATTGAALDPGNAYFPLMAAGFEELLGDREKARHYLATAGGLDRFNSYASECEQNIETALQQEFGYRGEFTRLCDRSSYTLPDSSIIASVGQWVNKRGTLEDKRNLLNVADNMLRHGTEPMDIILGRSIAGYAIRPPLPEKASPIRLNRDELMSYAVSLDTQLAAAHLAMPFHGVRQVAENNWKLMQATTDQFQEQDLAASGAVLTWAQVLPAAGLAALILCCAWAGAGIAVSRFAGSLPSQMVPHLLVVVPLVLVYKFFLTSDPAWTVVLLLGIFQFPLAFLWLPKRVGLICLFVAAIICAGLAFYARDWPGGVVLLYATVWLVGLAMVKWFSNEDLSSRLAFCAGVVLAVATLACSALSWFAGIPGLFCLILWLLQRAALKPPTRPALVISVLTLTLTLICLTAVAATLHLYGGPQVPTNEPALVVVFLFTPLLFIYLRVTESRFVFGTCILALGAVYLAAVGYQLGMNGKEKLLVTREIQSADEIRHRARMNF